RITDADAHVELVFDLQPAEGEALDREVGAGVGRRDPAQSLRIVGVVHGCTVRWSREQRGVRSPSRRRRSSAAERCWKGWRAWPRTEAPTQGQTPWFRTGIPA